MKNEYGETALYGLIEHQSFYETDKNTTKKLKILLSLGADMFATNNDGVTIFDSIERRTTEDPNIRLILRTLALRKIAGLQPSIELKYERLMEQEDPNLWEYFQKCIEEINRMKSTNVFKSCSVFEILTKCQCELELHMRYNEFRRRFRLVNLSIFHVYVDDINEAFERAERYYNCVLDQENLINEALYNFFPEMFKIVDTLNGGLVMVSFDSAHLSCGDKASMRDVIAHINHIRQIAGVDHVGLGAGYDGISNPPTELPDVAGYPLLLAELTRDRRWPTSDIKKLVGGNLLRVLKEVEHHASTLADQTPAEEWIPRELIEDTAYCRYLGV